MEMDLGERNIWGDVRTVLVGLEYPLSICIVHIRIHLA